MYDKPFVFPGFHLADRRGIFSKPYSYEFSEVPFVIRELFWSRSARGTVRGMHYQGPPCPAAKLVWVSNGAIFDTLIDLRRGPTYGAISIFELSAENGGALFIPVGFGHGFQAMTDDAVVNYAQNLEFDKASDAGVNWRSLDFTWPLPVTETSARDDGLPLWEDFESPF